MTTPTSGRRPAGTPTGGQFAPAARPEPSAALHSPAEGDTAHPASAVNGVSGSDPAEGPLPEIRMSPMSWTFGHWANEETMAYFDLDAPYQRQSVWTAEQRRNLIKSLYMGLPVGTLIVSKLPIPRNARAGSKLYRVVDGKQRIETVQGFARNEFTVPSSWFRPGDLSDGAAGKAEAGWNDLSERGRRRFEMSTHVPALEFDAAVELLGRDSNGNWVTRDRTPEEILAAEAELYGLINSGGTAQTETDLERARHVAANPAGADLTGPGR